MRNPILSAFLLLFLLLPMACEQEEPETPLSPSKYAASEFSAEVAVEWVRFNVALVRTAPGFSPPVAARAFGYLGVALYESVVPGMEGYQTLAGQLSDLNVQQLPIPEPGKAYHWPLVVNAAMATLSEALFPNISAANQFNRMALQNKYEDNYRFDIDTEEHARSIAFGKAMGRAVYLWAATDPIGHAGETKNFPVDYISPTGPGKWEPTSTQVIPLQPYWGSARTFVPNCAAQTQPEPPITFSTSTSSRFYSQALEVYTVTKEITEEERIIAEYWADGAGTVTPPGHSMLIAAQLIEKEAIRLDQAALLFAQLGMALNDAFVSCWKCKFTHNLIRPESYIKKHIDASWKPLIATPPFPEYSSGHSTQSGAMLTVLSAFFGYNYAFTDAVHEQRTDINGTPRRFSNFAEAAREAAVSRLYGGIHFRAANERGLDQGMRVGSYVLALKYKNG